MVGCLMQLLTLNLALGLSLTAIIVSPAFGYAGVGFPVTAMGLFPRAWGAMLPLRWYVQILFDQASRGAPLRDTALPFTFLCILTIALTLLAWLRLCALARASQFRPTRTRRRTVRCSASLAFTASGGAC
jgi:ABC-2 type transport system permease protein